METSFLELKSKQVVNTVDGKCLGHITDVIFDVETARALGFIVPQPCQGFWEMFRGGRELFIPFNCVCKIGVDVILVDIKVDNDSRQRRNKPNKNNRFDYADIIALNNKQNNVSAENPVNTQSIEITPKSINK